MPYDQKFRDELKEQLLVSQEEELFTDRLNEMVFEIADNHVNRLNERLKFRIEENDLNDLREAAMVDCNVHGLKFKPERLTNPVAYISIIIRCSIARNLKKLKDG